MKKLLLFFAILFCSQFQSKASHLLGGEIRWECLSNGYFVFYSIIYRDCTGIPLPFDNQVGSLTIVGNPLPRNASNATISSIVMKPDSMVWRNSRNGDISPRCDSSGNEILCQDRDPGSVQQFTWKSDPIILKGIPPSNGWKFYLTPPCCRPNVTNLAANGSALFWSIMYPNRQRDNAQSCYDSSPEFLDYPEYYRCRGVEASLIHIAKDKDQDSLVYNWDRTYNSPPVAPQPVPYEVGYNFNRPTPDTSFDPRNKTASIDRNTGIVEFSVYNGEGVQDYLTVVAVSAIRDNRIISTSFREIPIFVHDCPPLDSLNLNEKPSIKIGTGNSGVFTINVKAGDLVSLPIVVEDLDVISGSSAMQEIELTPLGDQFSSNLMDTSLCINSPCAIVSNPNIMFDSLKANYVIKSNSRINATFNWSTSCSHLNSNGRMKSYFFSFKAKDNFCPIPGVNNSYLKVNVFPSEPNSPEILCVVETSNNNLEVSWDNSKTAQSDFVNWKIYRSSISGFQEIATIANYQTTSYIDNSSSLTSSYYVTSTNLGCNGSESSLQNDPIGIINDSIELTNNTLTALDLYGDYQWFDCGNNTNISGETFRDYTPKDTGVYAVIINRKGCFDTSACMPVFPVGLGQEELVDKLNIFPNPTNGLLNIESSLEERLELKVFSIQGKLVQEEVISNSRSQIQIDGEDGLYFITISNQKGEQANFKVVKN